MMFAEGPIEAACPRKFQKSSHPGMRSIKKVPWVVSHANNALPCKKSLTDLITKGSEKSKFQIYSF